MVTYAKKLRTFKACLLIALLLSTLLPAIPVHSQVAHPTSYTLDECDQVAEAKLRDELNRITQTIFSDEQSRLNVAEILDRNWRDMGMDFWVDDAVDRAIEIVRSDTPFWERIWSGWSPSKAEELATRVAEETFESEGFAGKFEELSTSVANEIVSEIRIVTARSASTALLCVQEFIGGRFSDTLAEELDRQIQADLEVFKRKPDTDKDFLDILNIHSDFAGGVTVIIGTRLGAEIAKRLARTLTKNIVGKILVRILGKVVTIGIPIVGWIIGGALIIKDVFDSRDGALPLIRDSIQSVAVKDELRKWMAEEVSKELRTEMPTLARNVANSTFRKWQDFREKFLRVLELAEEIPRFRSILDSTGVDQVAKLADLVTLLEESGTGQLESLIQSGRFGFVLALEEESLEILSVTGKWESLVSWAELAGELLSRVVDTELYRVASPSDFLDRAALEMVLALNAAEHVQKVMLLDLEERNAVLGLSTPQREQVLETLSSEQLVTLAGLYLTKLNAQKRNLLVDHILRDPELISELGLELVQKTLIGSQDFERTLNYIAQRTREKPIVGQAFEMLSAIRPALSGELPWDLFWNYDGVVLRVVICLVLGLIFLAFLWRIVFSRRLRQDVNVTVVIPDGGGSGRSARDSKRTESQ